MKVQKNARYWWADHLPIKNETNRGGYKRLKFLQTTVYCGYAYSRYIDESEQEIDICDSNYSNFGFNKKKIISDHIYCCDRKRMLMRRSYLRQVIYFNRIVECGSIYSIAKLFPAVHITIFKKMQKEGFIPPPNISIGNKSYYFFEHILAFCKVYNDLVLQGVFHPTVKNNYLHHAWLVKEWEKATKKIYDKPTKDEIEYADKNEDKQSMQSQREVVWL
ncbi:MAG: hypothetical protein J6Z11_09280 [Candidatus Riflebacteria bacterium]|nr:hypothetical protein [Candidatus Riflebacteria bacterium]